MALWQLEAQLVLQTGDGACEGELPISSWAGGKPKGRQSWDFSSMCGIFSQLQVQVLQCAVHMGLVDMQVVPLACCSALLQGNKTALPFKCSYTAAVGINGSCNCLSPGKPAQPGTAFACYFSENSRPPPCCWFWAAMLAEGPSPERACAACGGQPGLCSRAQSTVSRVTSQLGCVTVGLSITTETKTLQGQAGKGWKGGIRDPELAGQEN